MPIDNTNYDIPFRAPAIPYADFEYSRASQEQFHSVLRLYFNQIDNVLRKLASQVPTLVQITGDSTVSVRHLDQIIRTSGAATIALLLPSAMPQGAIVRVKHAGTGVLTVSTEGSETIDGASTLVVSTQYENNTLFFDITTSEWSII